MKDDALHVRHPWFDAGLLATSLLLALALLALLWIPLTALLVGWILKRSFRPLGALANAVTERVAGSAVRAGFVNGQATDSAYVWQHGAADSDETLSVE